MACTPLKSGKAGKRSPPASSPVPGQFDAKENRHLSPVDFAKSRPRQIKGPRPSTAIATTTRTNDNGRRSRDYDQ